MNDLKIYGINVGAVAFSAIPNINPALQTVVLVMTIVYTGMNIYIKLKDRNKKLNISKNLNLVNLIKWIQCY